MSVEQLKAQRKSKKSSFNKYAERRDAVKKIVSNIDSKLDDDVRDINNKIKSCMNNLEQGLKGCNKVTTICSDMILAKEGADSKMSDCRAYMKREQDRCQTKINQLDAEIKSLERQIKAEGGTVYFWE